MVAVALAPVVVWLGSVLFPSWPHACLPAEWVLVARRVQVSFVQVQARRKFLLLLLPARSRGGRGPLQLPPLELEPHGGGQRSSPRLSQTFERSTPRIKSMVQHCGGRWQLN